MFSLFASKNIESDEESLSDHLSIASNSPVLNYIESPNSETPETTPNPDIIVPQFDEQDMDNHDSEDPEYVEKSLKRKVVFRTHPMVLRNRKKRIADPE